MKYTSAEAAKLLRKLNDEHSSLLLMEGQSREFLAALGEDPESVRPAYDYAETQKKLEENEEKIRRVKHAVNVFNSTHVIAEFNMTIDEMLVYLPQLTQRAMKLNEMKSRLPKTRERASAYNRNSSVIDYRYANYDIASAAADYEKVTDLLAKAQTALDVINNTETMEIDI
ncbi:MAG: hypothetical protein IJF18_02200 [Oscillospiraceae bacterium]|nr:hypothetical protein [Oscillospiraceae bacterium]